MNRRTRSSRRGMTLMEVMVVIAIIVLLMGAMTAGISSMFRMAKRSTAELQASKLANTAQTYETLRHKPLTDFAVVLDDKPIDPWGTPYDLDPGKQVTSFAEDARRGGTRYDEDIVAKIKR